LWIKEEIHSALDLRKMEGTENEGDKSLPTTFVSCPILGRCAGEGKVIYNFGTSCKNYP